MLIPKFRANTDLRVYATDEWITNAHWLVNRKMLGNTKFPLPLRKLRDLPNGSYPCGVNLGLSVGATMPHLEKMIPKNKEGWRRIESSPYAVGFHNRGIVIGEYKYKIIDSDAEVWVNPDYVQLMEVGTCWADNEGKKIWIEHADTTLAILMQLRQG